MLIQLLLIQIITFGALIFILRMLFYRQLNSALSRLKELQEEAMIKEGQIKEELARAKEERFSEVEKGRKEARELLERAKKEAEGLRLKTEELADQERQKIISYGKEESERLRQELLSNMQNQALALSEEIIKSIFTEKGKENLHHQLIDELLIELEGLDKEEFSVRADKIKVSSALALTEEEKKCLKKVLMEKMGYEVAFEERQDPEIITGLIIQIGELVIDASLKNKLNKITPHLKNGR